MKKGILLFVLATSFIFNQFSFGQATDLMFSEYIEGSSNNKALEIFNGTGGAVDLANYEVWRISNGGDWGEFTYPLTGILADGDVFVIANSSAGPEITAEADMTSGATWYNGDDAVGLAKDIGGTMTLIDAIGEDGPDPGSGWNVAGVTNATGEQTLVRKADICSPTTDWASSAGTNASDSQWIVYDQDDFDYIGDHVSSCTGPVLLDANFSADQTNIETGATISYTDITIGGATPYTYAWDLDGDGFYDDSTDPNPSFVYNSVGTYTVSLKIIDADLTENIETKTDYITVYSINTVADIATLRASTIGEYYTLAAEVVLTFQQSFRNQKYIQDGTAAILIDDNSGIISTIYAVGEGITGITGTLGEYGGMMQFIPGADPGVATSTGNVITPQVVTIDDLNDAFDDYEAELVQILGVTFDDAGLNFENGEVYSISDGAKATGNFRTTFYDVDYISTVIPFNADIVVLPNSRTDGNYVTSRSAADIVENLNPAVKLAVISVNNGVNPYLNTDFEVIVQAQDVDNNPGFVSSDINFTLTTNGGDLGTTAFVGGTTTNGVLLNGTSEITLSGVQMTPTGTGVNITVTDDDIFGGLIAGTSSEFDVVELYLPEIIITEIMQNPSAVNDTDGEWFEVYNNDDDDVDMINWIIKDDGSDSHIIATSLIVPSKGFAVFGINADQPTNGGFVCDYEYSTFTLANGDDEVILLLPDGVTEADRVNYDGGALWPDPDGSSMVYTGFPSDDNNIGSNWVYATYRELSYDETAVDKGSPGTNGYDQIMTGGFKLDLKAYLEAPFVDADGMSTYYRSEGLLPDMHPFNPTLPYYGNNAPAWLYSGTETIGYLPELTTDYLLIELRDASTAAGAGSGTMVIQMPALLSNTGTITSLNGIKPLNINTAFTNDVYIVIWSINHLGILSSTGLSPVDGTTMTYDFSTGSGQVYGGDVGYKQLDVGIWGLMSGDINGDQIVNDDDNTEGWGGVVGSEAVYQGNNLFPDNQIDNKDKNDFWVPNYEKSSSVPN